MIGSNPIAYAQYTIRGGWKGTGVVAGIYAVAIVILYAMARSVPQADFARASFWTTLLMAIQSATLVLFATARVGSAIRGDLAQKIIESHRLMPLPATHAVAGYIIGGAAQPLIFAATTFALGVAISISGRLDVNRWVLGNAILFAFAAFILCVISLMAFATPLGGSPGNKAGARGSAGWLIGAMAMSFGSGGMILIFIPALGLLLSPIIGNTIYVTTTGSTAPTEAYAVSFIGQVVIGTLYFFAAARRYRSAQDTGFTPLAALALLAAWVALTIYAIHREKIIVMSMPTRQFRDADMPALQTAIGTASAMLLALLPLGAASRFYRSWQIKRTLRDPGIGPRPIHPLLVAVLAAAICWMIAFLSGARAAPLGVDFLLQRAGLPRLAAEITMGLMLLAFMVATGSVLRLVQRAAPRRGGMLVMLFLILWIAAPIVFDFARNIAAQNNGSRADFSWSRVSGVSPVGTLINLYAIDVADPLPGAIVQWLIAIGCLTAFLTVTRAKSQAPAPLP